MSASTERLLEEIRTAEEALASARVACDQVGIDNNTAALKALRESLSKANQALTEGKQLIKG